jgi:hypothetical protein
MLYDYRKDLNADQRMLLDAADLIEERGWCQGSYSDQDGRVCAIGAIVRAGNHQHYRRAEAMMMMVVGMSVVGWNDIKGRTKEEVITALRRAALEHPDAK